MTTEEICKEFYIELVHNHMIKWLKIYDEKNFSVGTLAEDTNYMIRNIGKDSSVSIGDIKENLYHLKSWLSPFIVLEEDFTDNSRRELFKGTYDDCKQYILKNYKKDVALEEYLTYMPISVSIQDLQKLEYFDKISRHAKDGMSLGL